MGGFNRPTPLTFDRRHFPASARARRLTEADSHLRLIPEVQTLQHSRRKRLANLVCCLIDTNERAAAQVVKETGKKENVCWGSFPSVKLRAALLLSWK